MRSWRFGTVTRPLRQCSGAGIKPKAHLRDDAETALAEEPGGIGAVAVAVFLPATRRRHRAHAGAHDLAVRQHDLHAGVRAEVVAVVAHRVADAVIHRVADEAAPARIRRVDPHVELVLLDVAIEIDVGDARLDEREVALVVADENAVHALQIDRDAAAHVRRRAAVGEVLARRDRVQRNLVFVRRPDDRLHLLRRIGADGRRRDQLVRLVLDVREVVAIRVQVVVAREHPVAADGVLKLANGRLKRLCTDSGRQDRHNPSLNSRLWTRPRHAAR